MSSSAALRGTAAGKFRHSRLLRLSVYLLILSLCMPTDLYSGLFPGHRQLLLPLTTLLALLAWIVCTRGRLPAIRGQISLIWVLLSLFLGFTVLSAVIHPNATESLALVAAYLTRFVMFFVLTQILTEDPALLVRVERLLTIGLAALALLVVIGFAARLAGHLWLSSVIDSKIVRASAGLGDPNFTALAFNVGVALAFPWFATARTRTGRGLAIAAILVLVLGIGRTVSIGGLIGLMVVLALSAVYLLRPAGPRRWMMGLLTAGVLGVIAAVAGGAYLERLQQQVVRAQHSIGALGSERVNLSLGGLRMALAHPLLGVGPTNVPADMPPYLLFPISNPNQGPHNGFIAIMDETGVPSFLLIFVAGALLLARSTRIQRRLRKRVDPFWFLTGEGAWIALVATLVQTLALGTQRSPMLWLVCALVLALALNGTVPESRPP